MMAMMIKTMVVVVVMFLLLPPQPLLLMIISIQNSDAKTAVKSPLLAPAALISPAKNHRHRLAVRRQLRQR